MTVFGVAAVACGHFLTVVIEAPLVAPTRENPALFVVMWIVSTAAAFGAGELAGILARLTQSSRRRSRWACAAAVVASHGEP